MSHAAAAALGAIAGATIFIGLPVGRIRGFSRTVQGILNAIATGAVAFAVVLVIGFALHNITEGFGIAAPLALDTPRPSWGFLLIAGLVGGGPTFFGTVIGYVFTSTYVYVLFLALAAGALLYVVNEMFHLGRRLNSPAAMGWGLLLGFLLGYATDLVLTYNAA